MKEEILAEQQTPHPYEEKIIGFLFDKVRQGKISEGDTFETIEGYFRANHFSEEEINYAKDNFSHLMKSSTEGHETVVNPGAAQALRPSGSVSVLGIIYIFVGIGFIVYFNKNLTVETLALPVFWLLWGAYKIYSGSQTR